MKTKANNIHIFRAKYNMTQDQLASKIGVTRQSINQMERGHDKAPSVIKALQIAQVFDTKVENIFTDEHGL